MVGLGSLYALCLMFHAVQVWKNLEGWACVTWEPDLSAVLKEVHHKTFINIKPKIISNYLQQLPTNDLELFFPCYSTPTRINRREW